LQSPKTAADQSISRYLLPRLIAFTTNAESEDPENARALVIHALTAFVTTLSGQQKAVAMSVIVPTLLARANSEGEDVYRETSARLLDLASSDQAAFRGVVNGMTDAQKGFMENVIVAGRQAQGQKAQDGDEEEREPTIALRMDFGV
jgi:HEAT repeat-containing protein 5